MKNTCIISLLKELSEKQNKKNLKFYTPELMIKKTSTGAKYEVSEVDFDNDEDNPIVKVYRYDPDGSRVESFVHTGEEIKKNFEIA